MPTNDIRRGIVQAKENEKGFGFLAVEVFIIAILAGLIAVGYGMGIKALWILGGVWLCLLIMIQFKKLLYFLCILFSIIWTLIAFTIALNLGGWIIAIIVSLIVLFTTLGYHFAAIQHIEDLKR
ncbi:hypothetical protein P9B03_02330 [Metasolibacillus meyeri]|uniref:Uncharacterized protein n=1 Tax=Metasolibacillus meyeri TaxID=1071052 RepID=A0AAW9NSX1_9BACL|nr:hypothetical protein [Metasolibacillus meyeri]MEC1177308.1 hypothetical protein [Metasolibacillus meyeri]